MGVKPTLIESFVANVCTDDFVSKLNTSLGIGLNRELASSALKKSLSIPKMDFGDLAFNSFVFLNAIPELKTKFPRSEINKLVQIISDVFSTSNLSIVDRVVPVAPYVNIFLNPNELLKIAFDNYWFDTDLSSNRGKILIEHTSINPSGPVNVARIRNSFIGDTLVRIHKALGFDVDVHYYVNDVGKQVAILAVAKMEKVPPDENLMKEFSKYKDRPDFKTFFVYVPANKLYNTDPSFKSKVEELLKKCELGDEESLAKLKETAKFCLDGQIKSLERVGIRFDSFDFESQFLESGKVREIIDRLKSLPEHSTFEGNHVLNLEKYGIKSRFGGVVFERSNGTSVYLTRDIAYHIMKLKLADKLITVLGEDHKAEFKTLKTILKMLGVLDDDSKLDVVHFAFVNFSGKKMSTRRGLIVPLDAVIDEGVDEVLKILNSRDENFSDGQKQVIAEAVAASAIRYFELKVAPSKQISFDWESALNFEGQTGPYIQYSLVRAKKIIEKSKLDPASLNIDYVDSKNYTDSEKELLKKILDFRKFVEDSAYKKAPHILALYAYELANTFSKFYEESPVLVDDRSLMTQRLIVVVLFKNVMSKLLELLGLSELEEM